MPGRGEGADEERRRSGRPYNTVDAPRLTRAFFGRDAREVARELLYKLIIRRTAAGELLAGRVVEVEAYLGAGDPASHAARGETARNAPMFGPPGFAYVYLIYGMWSCLNVVTGPAGAPAAVLLRAAAPLPPSPFAGDIRAASGPGRLCRAFAVDTRLNREDLVSGAALWLADDGAQPEEIVAAPRVGVDYAGPAAEWPWRFLVARHPAVSKPP
jgi:DNA-3-methyladenine glycosylase